MSLKITSVKVLPEEKSTNKTRFFVFLDNESRIDDLVNRFNRPSKVYRKEVLPKVIEKLKTIDPELYKLIKDDKWLWSQYAGCSCGCSPGFVGSIKTGKGLYVHVKEMK